MGQLFIILTILACVQGASGYLKTITCRNKTGAPLSIMTIDRPLTPAQAAYKHAVWLRDEEEVIIVVTDRLVGWYQHGVGTGMTVMDESVTELTFIKNNGEIKTIHGELRSVVLRNSKPYDLTVTTKNSHENKQDCTTCAHTCYRQAILSDWCDCLDYCADTSRDLTWYLDAYNRKRVTVGSGATLRVTGDEYVYDDEDEETTTVIYRRVEYQ